MGLDNPLHIAFLVVVLVLLFGARRLPEIGRSLGAGMREFKEAISGESSKPTLGPGQPAQEGQAQQLQTPPPVQAPPQPTQTPPPEAPVPETPVSTPER